MTINVTPGAGATLGTRDLSEGHLQGVIQQPAGRFTAGATFHFVGSVCGTLAVPASAQMALLALNPGPGIRWTTGAPSANGSIGLPLFAQGSYPEALEISGASMLAKFNYALLAGETATAGFFIEYYGFKL